MPLFRVDINRTYYDTIEEIKARNSSEAITIARTMFSGFGSKDILYHNKKPSIEYIVEELL